MTGLSAKYFLFAKKKNQQIPITTQFIFSTEIQQNKIIQLNESHYPTKLAIHRKLYGAYNH
jgi:hypothetical protein